MSPSQNDSKKIGSGEILTKKGEGGWPLAFNLSYYYFHLVSFYEDDALPFFLRYHLSLFAFSSHRMDVKSELDPWVCAPIVHINLMTRSFFKNEMLLCVL
jgi:hypothetical protein